MSDEHRRKWQALVESLKEIETDELASGEQLRGMVEWANRHRANMGIEPLEIKDEESDERPEEELYRRARALGMVGRGRRGRRADH